MASCVQRVCALCCGRGHDGVEDAGHGMSMQVGNDADLPFLLVDASSLSGCRLAIRPEVGNDIERNASGTFNSASARAKAREAARAADEAEDIARALYGTDMYEDCDQVNEDNLDALVAESLRSVEDSVEDLERRVSRRLSESLNLEADSVNLGSVEARSRKDSEELERRVSRRMSDAASVNLGSVAVTQESDHVIGGSQRPQENDSVHGSVHSFDSADEAQMLSACGEVSAVGSADEAQMLSACDEVSPVGSVHSFESMGEAKDSGGPEADSTALGALPIAAEAVPTDINEQPTHNHTTENGSDSAAICIDASTNSGPEVADAGETQDAAPCTKDIQSMDASTSCEVEAASASTVSAEQSVAEDLHGPSLGSDLAVMKGQTAREQAILQDFITVSQIDSGWQPYSQNPPLVISRQMRVGGPPANQRPLQMWRICAVLTNTTPRAVFEILMANETQQTWNTNVQSSATLSKDDGITLIRTNFKGMGPVAARELLEFRAASQCLDDDVLWIAFSSCGTESLGIPVSPGCALAYVNITGYRLSRGAEPRTVAVTFITHGEAGGKIPDFVVKAAGAKGPSDLFRDLQVAVNKLQPSAKHGAQI